ncbi:fructuronate reductase [Plantibacter sp. Leaf171]|uniref:mannitol dehydrogenase family protein n=1 Tax=unclassified Plantibacter TaxID=2624265 RepID=UPI0006F906AF|nr:MULTISPECIES: mannitol dehydrogenase family protein [unclassified Plantibacter]KQM16688.1 fructuronate reductase [Plantibacter sp. Leaf1]KQR59824.1 fructuronate reductase [Plantibacter sp. Leaf171]
MTGPIGRLGAGSAPQPGHPVPSAAGVLHLGLGNFHRAHQAVYTAAALRAGGDDWGIIGVASRSRTVVDAMQAQDLRYAVAEISPSGTAITVPAVHTDVFVAAADPQRVVAGLADERIRVVTLTVTEHGYSTSPSTGLLDLSDPLIAADLRGGAPRTTIGQLARGLQRRASGNGAPVTILSCDNLSENGARTEALVRTFLGELPGSEGAEALAYLDSAVAFPSSMVDRIVPATTAQLRDLVSARLGVRDESPVSAEPFTMWAIEDRFAAARPAWEAGGAVFTDEVGAYEQMKVRLLNGTHSLIAYLGALRGAATISEAIAMPDVESAARSILHHEYEPSVRFPAGVDVDTYEAQLFERWANHALGHRTAQVGTDGSVKLRQRIPEPALRSLDSGSTPHLIALTVAAYLSCIAPMPGFDPGPHARAMVDPAREELARLADASTDGAQLAHRVIAGLHLFGQELAERPAFIARVGELIDTIARHGVDAAIQDSVAATARPTTTTGALR